MTIPESPYVGWLRDQGVPLFEAGGTIWRTYHRRVLVPAPCAPVFTRLDTAEARAILRKSGAFLLRHCSEPTHEPTSWWYVLCDQYDVLNLTHKTRQKINRGKRDCHVRRIDTSWLLHNGYGCYEAAFERYKHARPVSRSSWQASIRKTATGPFEYWGVFVGDALAGFCQVVVETGCATTIAGKYDPRYFKHRPVELLTHCLAQHYVVERGLILNNGMRSVLHDTNMQDFLLHHGFRKQYCRLKIVYLPLVGTVVKLMYPARHVVKRISDASLFNTLSAVLLQEEIRRACARTAKTPSDRPNEPGATHTEAPA